MLENLNITEDTQISELVAGILALDDKEVLAFQEIMIDEMRKAASNKNDLLRIQQEIESTGATIEELIATKDELPKLIEENFGSELSQVKKDFFVRMMDTLIDVFIQASGYEDNIVTIPIELMDYGIEPTYAHDGDAAMDIYSPIECDIAPGETVNIKSGIKVAVPRGYALLVQPRSGQSLKTKLRIPNSPGLIDSGYRGEIGIMLENIESPVQELGEIHSPNTTAAELMQGALYGQSYHIDKGQRIAQMRLVEVPQIKWQKVEHIGEDTIRGTGGFGSSGE